MEGDVFHRAVNKGPILDVFHYALSKMNAITVMNDVEDDVEPVVLDKPIINKTTAPVTPTTAPVAPTTAPVTPTTKIAPAIVKKPVAIQPVPIEQEPVSFDEPPPAPILPLIQPGAHILIPIGTTLEDIIEEPPPVDNPKKIIPTDIAIEPQVQDFPPIVDYHPKPEDEIIQEEEPVITEEPIPELLIPDILVPEPSVPDITIPEPEEEITTTEGSQKLPIDENENYSLDEETGEIIDENENYPLDEGTGGIIDVDEILDENENYSLDEETGEIIDETTGEVVYNSDGVYVGDGSGSYVSEETSDEDGGYIQQLPKGLQITGYVYPYLFLVITVAGGTAGFLVGRYFKQSTLSSLALVAAGLMAGSAIGMKVKPPVKV